MAYPADFLALPELFGIAADKKLLRLHRIRLPANFFYPQDFMRHACK